MKTKKDKSLFEILLQLAMSISIVILIGHILHIYFGYGALILWIVIVLFINLKQITK